MNNNYRQTNMKLSILYAYFFHDTQFYRSKCHENLLYTTRGRGELQFGVILMPKLPKRFPSHLKLLKCK